MYCVHGLEPYANKVASYTSWFLFSAMATIETSWMAEVEDTVNAINSSAEEELLKKVTIYEVPAFLRDLNPKAFTPKVVSLGPYHHGEEHLKPMEVHKKRALAHFLKRVGKPLNDVVSAVGSILQQLQDSYHSLGEEWREGDRFLKLMIFDGWFMLEVLQFTSSRRGYPNNDPFFSDHGISLNMPYIRRDMLMLENQLPLLLLKKLAAVEDPQTRVDDNYINKLMQRFVAHKEREAGTATMSLGLHALDLLRQSMLRVPCTSNKPPASRPPPSRQVFETYKPIGSVIELDGAGVRFKQSTTASLNDISFSGADFLCLPPISVDNATESLLRNLMAFEHLHVTAGKEVTSYVSFMSEIIVSAKDVSILKSKGIIQNFLSCNEDVASLFKGLSKEIFLEPDESLWVVRSKLHVHSQKPRNKWRAELLNTYFYDPWIFLSLINAIFIIMLTISQTVFSVLQFYGKGK